MAGTAAVVIAIALLGEIPAIAWIFASFFAVAVLAVVFRDFCAAAHLFHTKIRPRLRQTSPLPARAC